MINFGTETRPLRPSSLGKLLKCQGQVVLSLDLDSEGSAATNTGSLVHAGIEGFHKGNDSPQAGEEAMAAAVTRFPQADWAKASAWYAAYAKDPTNYHTIARLNHESWAVEVPVKLVYKGVHIQGTLDQIRLVDGVYSVWDVKTGSGFHSPEDTVAEHAAQQAAYVLAARQTTGLDVQPGGIIYMYGYNLPRGRRFIPMGATLRQCELLLDEVVLRVESIRRSGPSFTPSADACKFCPFKPYPTCTERYHDAND